MEILKEEMDGMYGKLSMEDCGRSTRSCRASQRSSGRPRSSTPAAAARPPPRRCSPRASHRLLVADLPADRLLVLQHADSDMLGSSKIYWSLKSDAAQKRGLASQQLDEVSERPVSVARGRVLDCH